jgi:copper chaperone CopZ
MTRALVPLVAAVMVAAAFLCPICEDGVPVVEAQAPVAADSTVRFHVTGMTCGSCATTARTALRRLAGVRSAAVSYDSATATVRFDARQVNSAQIASHLLRMTGYRATVIADSAAPNR